jgi:hypothetical protein
VTSRILISESSRPGGGQLRRGAWPATGELDSYHDAPGSLHAEPTAVIPSTGRSTHDSASVPIPMPTLSEAALAEPFLHLEAGYVHVGDRVMHRGEHDHPQQVESMIPPTSRKTTMDGAKRTPRTASAERVLALRSAVVDTP